MNDNNIGENKILNEESKINIPYFVHEGEMARADRNIKRLWIALIISIVIAFVTNVAWIIYDSQYDKTSYEQDGEGINNINMGEQGDIRNGTDTSASDS